MNKNLLFLSASLLLVSNLASGQMVTGSGILGYAETLGLQDNSKPAFKAAYLGCSVPANILWPGDEAVATVQVVNVASSPLRTSGHIEVIRYATRGIPNDIWKPQMFRIAVLESIPVSLDLAPNAWTNIVFTPAIPETKGAYAFVLDLDNSGRVFLTSLVRTFAQKNKQPQYPQFCMDIQSPDALTRLGVSPNRIGVSYHQTTSGDFEDWYRGTTARLKEYQKEGLPVTVEIGGGDWHKEQPLGRPRPWLDEKGQMTDTMFDLAWLPSYDPDFKILVKRLISDFGWPRGPINGIKLWNEPWEGLSISGWGSDMLRYREIFRVLADATHEACAEGNLDVLVGGCDSASNTFDKFFSDGSDTWLKDLDFCSIHYQGMFPPSTFKAWKNRQKPKGRVRIWDTESWVANCDDRVAAVVAGNISTGHDRAVGVYGGNVISGENYWEETQYFDDHGEMKKKNVITAWSVAASVGAVSEFIGARSFERLAYTNGLPWVMIFNGRHESSGSPQREDGTVVVVGDLGEEFESDNLWLRTARGIREKDTKQPLIDKLAKLPADDPARAALLEEFNKGATLQGASMSLAVPAAADGKTELFSLFDFYGNPIASSNGTIIVALDGRGFFLRANGQPGSFDALLKAVDQAKLTGIEPVAVVCHDLLAPVDKNPEIRITLQNVLNRPIHGSLQLQLTGLVLDPVSQSVSLAPHEAKTVAARIVAGTPSPQNLYPLSLRFDAGVDGLARHVEDMRVNTIAKRTIVVDGDLADWKDVVPQIVRAPASGPSRTEAAWLPFKADTTSSNRNGYAEGYLAADNDFFYLAVRILDSTPHPGMPRYETLDEDSYFYPATSYVARLPNARFPVFTKDDSETPQPLIWPEGVRRFTYRKDPELPCGNFPGRDNVQIAFNVIPPEDKPWDLCPPGTFPRYAVWATTDYEFALNPVAETFGGGTEIWRLQSPKIPHKHFYPHQPKSPFDGPVKNGMLKIQHVNGTRFVEAAIPWPEIPEAKAARDAGQTVKFSFRVNDDSNGACLELSRKRSVAKRSGNGSFTADWKEHWDNELEFSFEK